jgi:TatD DNase family protein
LPIVVHDRDAHEDIYQMIKSKVQSRGIKGVIHCFSGDRDFAQKMMDLDFVLSFAGQITFKNAEVLRDAAKFVPLTSMLVETDSPYLTPVPHRGQRNEPAYVKFTAEKIAEIKQVSFEAVAQQTTANAQRVFKI